ncbi:MAG: PAS domain S-box protein [Desulfomonile tiedjei]|uniref:histidine kinase n=1 Tax=Desulfomonile tiedjei TaxID=2358 RepID=A0A9D6UZM8_9BACT|nr:PAS domain S-box protein [Desulfomonile tiedjei]
MDRFHVVPDEEKAHPPDERRFFRVDGPEVDEEMTAIPYTYKEESSVKALSSDITQRKSFPGDLYRSREAIEALLNASTELAFLLDTRGNFIELNQAIAVKLGDSIERLRGTSAFDYIPRDVACYRRAQFEKVLRTGKSVRFEDERKGRIFDNSMCPVVSDDGRVEGVAVFARDITETKLAEQRVNLEKQKFQAIAEHGPCGMGMLDNQGTVIYLNPKFQEIMGYSLQDIPDEEHWFRAVHPDPAIRSKIYENWKRRLRRLAPGESASEILSVVCKSGNVKTISFKIMVLDSGERIISLEDITDRVAAERVLKESEQRYRRLFEDSPISLWEEDFSAVKSYLENLKGSGVTDFREYFEKNPDAVVECAGMVKVLDVNRATLDLYEADSKNELLQDLSKVFVKESLGGFREGLIRIAEGNTEFEAESVNVSLMGNLKHVSVRIIVAPGFEENLSKIIVAVLDITDRKRAEESLKASLREKEVLLSEIHHRVKNNLQIISSLLRLQSRNIPDPDYKRIFMESQDRVQSMALMHEDLYESRDLGNVDFRGYVNRLVNNLFLSYGIDQSRINFQSEIDRVSIGIDTAVPCGLITNELISNSLKHAFPHNGAGEIGVALKSTGEGRFELSVWDNGIGMGQGLDLEQAQTLGFRLVTTLTRQLRGKIVMDQGPGSRLIISFSA